MNSMFPRFASIPLVVCAVHVGAQEMPVGRISDEAHGIYDNDLLSPEFHRGRREALRAKLPEGGVAVFFANPVRKRSNDVYYEYHQDPDLYYLTGLTEPDAVLLVFKEPRQFSDGLHDELLVVRERDPKREVWEGIRLGADGARDVLGVEKTMTGKELLTVDLPWRDADKVYISSTKENLLNDPHNSADLSDLMDRVDATLPKGTAKGDEDLERWTAELRQMKLPEELALMRRAIEITCEAQKDLMRKLKPDMTEYQTEAIVEYVFKSSGAEHEGYPSILGGGAHSCVLHYETNRGPVRDGDLLLSDVGAEYHGYTADVTRTMPANGHFTPDQRKIYDIVLAAQEAGIAASRAGRAFRDPHNAAWAVVVKGLKGLGIVKDESEVKRYFMHGTSHYLGLDVHDAGLYGPLEAGQVITVEPGIYIAENSPCDPRWWGIGVRIEDDILITDGEPENLSISAPRTAEEVEALMAK
ncbi:MAG TPA: aminopeptidase P N-terminal domain-containing protein [Flavobacteriales bacterium]|nr:aminopeptidase P N-terminal domain-containing protein [Flavobacteriales bacterium]